jgi:hypothetical protein
MTIASFSMSNLSNNCPIALPLNTWDDDAFSYRAFFYGSTERFTETLNWRLTKHDRRVLSAGKLKPAYHSAAGRLWCPVLFFPEEWPPHELIEYIEADYRQASLLF